MDSKTFLDELELAGSVQQGDAASNLGQAYFERLVGYYGTDNERLTNLGQHWRKLLRTAHDRAWVYRAGGVYERAKGNWNGSAEAFQSAGGHATDPLSKASFQVGAIDSLARAGKIAEAHVLASRLRSRLRKLGEPGLAARAMLNLGNALVYQDRMPEARRVLSKALPELEAAGLRLEAASARLGLSSTHLFGGSPRIAERLAEQVVADASALGADYLVDLARLNLALALVVTGRSDQAYQILINLRPELESSPVDRARVEEYLADALLQLNLWSEAEETYRQILDRSESLPLLHRANLELGLGRALMDQGRSGEAAPFLLRARRGYARINNRAWEAVSLHFQAVVEAASGKDRSAQSKLHEAAELAHDSPYHLSQILLTLSQCGEDRVHQAHALIRKHGYLDLEWSVHYLKAKAAHYPLVHYRRMFRSILVGRMATQSVAARIGFLRDKEEALRDYLGWLLARPTSARVREAMSVVEQVRSVTLLDEILRQGTVPAVLQESFEELRSEIGSALDQAPNGHSRLQMPASVSMARAQKTVTEGLMRIGVSTRKSDTPASNGVVLVETSDGLRILQGDRAIRPVSLDREIIELLRWLPFELMAPMADREADPAPAEQLLRRLGESLYPLWNSTERSICPDGFGWRIPWTACGELMGMEGEWAIKLHPWMNSLFAGPLTSRSKAMVWLGQAEDLPFSGREAEAIAAKFEDCRIVSTAAEARRTLAEEFDAIHVVSHAIHRPENPMLSSIEFPDGPVFATEIARSDLKVKLATLSACETGSISLQTRSEPDGIARAFLARGAQSAIASQWPLDDEAACLQFDAIYTAVLNGEGLFEALKRSRCICRGWRAHPYYWGALALYLGYSR